VVISNDVYNRKTADVVVVAMTSNPAPVDYGFMVTSADLGKGTLNRPAKIRVDKIYTLAQSIVVKTFGRVNSATLDRIRQTLQDLTAKKP
jgi:mRNA interferase MazF